VGEQGGSTRRGTPSSEDNRDQFRPSSTVVAGQLRSPRAAMTASSRGQRGPKGRGRRGNFLGCSQRRLGSCRTKALGRVPAGAALGTRAMETSRESSLKCDGTLGLGVGDPASIAWGALGLPRRVAVERGSRSARHLGGSHRQEQPDESNSSLLGKLLVKEGPAVTCGWGAPAGRCRRPWGSGRPPDGCEAVEGPSISR